MRGMLVELAKVRAGMRVLVIWKHRGSALGWEGVFPCVFVFNLAVEPLWRVFFVRRTFILLIHRVEV